MHFIKLLLLTFFLIGCGQADRGKAYVTSQDGGVSVIDLNSFEVIESLDIGGLPRGLGITDDGKFLVAANKDHASITVLDLATKKVVNDILRFSFANYIADFFWSAAGSILPIMVLNLLGAESTAYFYIAWSVGGICMVVSGAVSISLFAEGSYDEERLGLNIWRSVKLILITLVPIIILVFAIAPWLLLLFGGSYSESGTTLLRIMSVSALPWSINVVYLSKLRVERKLKVIIGFTVVIAVLSLGLSYFLLPRMGINGVGFAWLATHGIIAFVVMVTSLKGRQVINSARALIFTNKGG